MVFPNFALLLGLIGSTLLLLWNIEIWIKLILFIYYYIKKKKINTVDKLIENYSFIFFFLVVEVSYLINLINLFFYFIKVKTNTYKKHIYRINIIYIHYLLFIHPFQTR